MDNSWGDHINYSDDVGMPTVALLLIKIILNSVISTPGERFVNADISSFYLMTQLKCPKFTRIKLNNIPVEVIHEYKLKKKVAQDDLH